MCTILIFTVFFLNLLCLSHSNSVRLPPSIKPLTEAQRNHFYNLDGPTKHIMLPCEVHGIPQPKVSWKEDGVDISRDKILPNGTYKELISSVQHEGFYQCFAENDHGKAASNKIRVQRAKIPQGDPNQITRRLGKKGGYLMLRAQVDAESCVPQEMCKVTWHSNGKTIEENNKRIAIDQEGNLHFSHLTELEKNLPVNSATLNSLMSTQSEHSFHIINFEGGEEGERLPEIRYSTNPKVFLEGQELHLQCIFSARPAISEMIWRRNGHRLYSDKRTEIKGHSLNIKNLKLSEGGAYSCQGLNSRGSSSPKEIFLIVKSTPRFTSSPRNTNKTIGENVEFYCDATGIPQVNIQWTINWEPVEDHPLYGRKISLTADHRLLRVTDLSKEYDNTLMVVQCNASNAHGYAFANGYINVLEKAHLTVVPKDIVTDTGKEAMFNCQGDTDASKVLSIMWFHDDKIVIYDDKRQLLKNNSLYIKSVKPEHEGVYRCELNDGLSQASGEATLRIILIAVSVVVFWLLMVLAMLCILVVIIVIIICKRRNQKIGYKVGLNEAKYGLDPYEDIKSADFKEFQRPEGDKPSKGSRASLTKSLSLASEDSGSLDEYGMPKPEKFAEDGSFIGEYSPYKIPKSSFV